ncbi:phospholipase, patatin family [Ostertagia ostertagi]
MCLVKRANGELSECFFLYWNMKRQIFLEGSTMSRLFGDQVTTQTRNIEKVLSDCFPTQSFQKCDRRLTVPALDISMAPARLHIFRNYSFTRPFGAPLDEEQDIMFKDAARASSAAPTYFEPFSYQGKKFVDGSFVANYPLNILFKVVGQDLTTVEMAQERCHAHNIPDQIDDGKLMDMIWTTQLWLVDNLREVDKLGELLFKLLSDPDDGKRRSNTVL